MSVPKTILFFLTLTLAMTFPLACQMASALPENLGDPLLNAWIIGWGAQRLPAGLDGFWQAPIFFPYDRTLAYSEHLLGVTVFVAPIYWATGNAVLAYNVAFVASYVLAALGLFLLVRALTGRTDAALVAAVIFAFSPIRTGGQIARLQILMAGWLPLALLALHRYLKTGARRHLAGFVLAYLLGSLSNTYFLYFFPLPVVVVAVHGLVRMAPNRRRAALELALCAVLLLAVLAPVVYPYYLLQRSAHLQRTVEENVEYSADLSSYAHVWFRAPQARWLPAEKVADRALFLGFTVYGLAAIGLGYAAAARFRRRHPEGAPEPWGTTGLTRGQVAIVYGVTALAALVLSMGPEPKAWGHPLMPQGPYAALMALVPGLDGLRAPARFSVIVSLCLAVLAGCGVAGLLERRSGAARAMVVALLCGAVLAESYRLPVRMYPFDPDGAPDRRAAYSWIARTDPGAVLVLPISDLSYRRVPVANATPALMYQYATLWHGHPIVNGTSGYTSPLMAFFQGFASPFWEKGMLVDGVEGARRLGVRYVVIHVNDYADHDIGRAAADLIRSVPGLVVAWRQFDMSIVIVLAEATAHAPSLDGRSGRLTGVTLPAASDQPALLPLALDGSVETGWSAAEVQNGSEWIEVGLDRPRDVGALRLAMGAGAFVEDFPRTLVVESLAEGRPPVVLFEGSVLPAFVEGLVRSPEVVPIDLELPPNRSERLRLRQTGQSPHRRWSIPEIVLWER